MTGRNAYPPSAPPWWDRGVHADRREGLMLRGRVKSAIRGWFEAQGFVEVDTSCLQVSPGNETHLHAFATEMIGTDLARTPLYLHTSPEFACKKLLAAGEQKIFTFAPCFRNRERGGLHAPEFTMLEWYRVGQSYEVLWEDCAAILKLAAAVTGLRHWSWRGRTCDMDAHLQSTTLDQAFVQYAGITLRDMFKGGKPDRDVFARAAAAAGIRPATDDTWSDIFSRVLTERIEPRLGNFQPEILYQYPTHEAALARPVPDDPLVAERFELYVCGVELANGFGELTDAAEQRLRFELAMTEKQRIYGEHYPIDEDFLRALSQMPPASGCALGFDRLVMLATSAVSVDQVLWTPVAEPGR